jgi:tetratricopeptide (TPR) repeat protein
MLRNIIVIALILIANVSFSQDPLLDSAKSAYDKAEYTNAIDSYQKILSQGLESGELRYNLANCYYRTNQIGSSILNYEKALKIMPGNEDVLFNLSIVNVMKKDKFENIPTVNFSNLLSSLNNVISFEFWAILSTLLILTSGGLFMLSKKNKNSKFLKLSYPVVSVGIVIGILSIQQMNSVLETRDGIVMFSQANILSEPNTDSTILLEVNEGSKLKIIGKDGNWLNVSTPANDKGWIETKNISEI